MNPPNYLIGFTSQENESEFDQLSIDGEIPDWLSGHLIRTGPSKFEVGSRHYRHWFDGLAMLHKFTFHNRKVSYTSRFLRSDAYLKAIEKNKIVYGEFGTDPCQDLFQRVFAFFSGPKVTDNGCVNINQIGGELTATTETTKPVRFSIKDLRTTGHLDLGDDVPGQSTIVHHHYDSQGTLYSFFTHFGYKTHYNVYAQPANSRKKKLIASVPADKPAYMHSLGMTENFLILTEFPLIANALQLRFGNKPFIENYRWRPQRGMKTYLIEKATGKVQPIETEPYFAFHHVNAFEQGDDIIMDIIVYENADVIDQLYLHRLRAGRDLSISGRLCRFTINPSGKKITKKIICQKPVELPRINYRRVNTREYRYVYGAGNTIRDNFLDTIIKIDVARGKENTWHKENLYPGEPVFVERPHAVEEDDGVLLSIVLNATTQTSFLLILDAKDLREIARVNVPRHIPFGFHGEYLRNTVISA